MKKLLLGLGSIAVIAAPVALVVSCGSDDTIKGVAFSTENGKVKITVDGTGISDKIVLIDKIEAAAKQQGITLPTNEGEIFGLIDLTTSTNLADSLYVSYFAQHPENFSRTPSSSSHSTQTESKTQVAITTADIIEVDLSADAATLKGKFDEYKNKYTISNAKFAIKWIDDQTSGTMVFLMNSGTDREWSFSSDTLSYTAHEITVDGTPWELNYGDSHAFDFFTIFEPAWINAINSEDQDSSNDVTQFDWSQSGPSHP